MARKTNIIPSGLGLLHILIYDLPIPSGLNCVRWAISWC